MMVGFAWNRVNRILSAVPLFLLFLFPGGGSSSEGRITIEVGTLSAEDGDGWILSQIHGFEAAHPNIDIRYFSIGSPSRDTVRVQDLPELALNVIGVRSDMGYEIGYLVENDLIVPIDSFLPDPDFHFNDFYPNVWDYVSHTGKRWGVPFLCSSVVFIADWDVFEKAGVREPPKSWEDFMRVLPLLTKDTDADGAIDQWGFRLGMRGRHDTHMFFLWMTKVLQDGGYVMKDGRFDLTHPSLRKAYEFMDRLQKSPGASDDNRRFKNSAGDLTYRYGMQIAPSYFLNPLMKQLNYRIIPWVTSGKEVILDERRHYLCVGKSTPEKEKASWEFLKWITRKEAEHPDGAWTFHLSARKDLLERMDVRHKIESWAKGFDVMHETKGWNVHHGDQVLGRFEAMDHFEGIVTDLFHGDLTFEEAMDKAEEECNAILSQHQRPETDPKPETLALVKSANSFRDGRDFKRASLDYLKLWDRFPEFVAERGFRNRIIACLKNAGYFLEAETLATTHRPGLVAGLILKNFQSDDPLTESYLKVTPVEQLLRSSDVSEPASIHELVHIARIASVSAFYGAPSLERFDSFIEKSGDLLRSHKGKPEEWSILSVYHRGVIDLAFRLQAKGDGSRSLIGEYELKSVSAREYAQRLVEDSIEIASAAVLADSNTASLVFDALDTRIEVGRKTHDLNGINASYRRVLDQFPDEEESPIYLSAQAIFLREEVQDLEGALAVCRDLEHRYPENELAKKVKMRSAIWLYEARRYEEAKPIFDSIAQTQGDNGEKAVVLSALCDYALGRKSEAEEAVRVFIAEHPDSELGQGANLWLISNRVADFQFLEASQMIRTFTGQNPNRPSSQNLGSIQRRLLEPAF